MRKTVIAVIAVAVLALTVAGCSGFGKTSSSSARAFSSSSQGQYDKAQAAKLAKECLPASETAQLRLLSPHKGQAARKAVEDCLEIPKAERQQFDDAFLNAALHAHLRTKAGRDTFATVTFPELLVQFRPAAGGSGVNHAG